MLLAVAPTNLGAMSFSIATDDQTTVTILSGRALPTQLNGTGTRRAILTVGHGTETQSNSLA